MSLPPSLIPIEKTGIVFNVKDEHHAGVILNLLKGSGFQIKEYHTPKKAMSTGGRIYARQTCIFDEKRYIGYISYKPHKPLEYVRPEKGFDTKTWKAIFDPETVLPDIMINGEIGLFRADGTEVVFGCAVISFSKAISILDRMSYHGKEWEKSS